MLLETAEIHDSDEWCLTTTDEGVSLCERRSGGLKNIRVDFSAQQLQRRGQRELLLKALGIRKGKPRYVIDATAGMGVDAFLIAKTGCEVTLLERSPLVAALLEDGIARARCRPDTQPVAARMQLYNVDSIEFLANADEGKTPDMVYLDPMFPQRDKSALPKKAMQSLQTLVGEDGDQVQLLDAALRAARYRVVVKRRSKVEPIGGMQPTFGIEGKQVRYDVYALRKLD